MQIIIGKYFVNKTWKFLIPTLKSYGETFLAKYSPLWKLSAGIYDASFEGKDEDEKLIYVLFDKLHKAAVFENILQFFKYQEYYHTDYAFDDLETGRMHMIVFKVAPEWHNAYDAFRKSEYSMMFNDKQIDFLFKNANTDALAILTRQPSAYNRMITNIDTSFGSKVTKYDLLGAELDFPLENVKEIFNYKKHKTITHAKID